MRYLLDSDTIIYLRKGHPIVEENIARRAAKDILTTTISLAELYYGAYHSDHVESHVKLLDTFFRHMDIVPFCAVSALKFGHLKADLRKTGQLIEDMDLMIASIAIHHRMTLVSNNVRHFQRIKDLKLENWLQEI
jgi:tRNA(fMet)-specific endonuclease VapC